MKVSKSFSLDLEVVQELYKRGLDSEWVNKKLREWLGLDSGEQHAHTE